MRPLTERRLREFAGRKGFTLVEAVISTVIVAVMLVAALSTVGASRSVQHQAYLADRGRLLAEELLAEVLQNDYQDPDETLAFGREATESAATRADFDDVDDYHGWSSSPPQARDGTPLAGSKNWRRSVIVEWVLPEEPSQVVGSESYAKRITVTAKYNDVPQATLVGVRTAGI